MKKYFLENNGYNMLAFVFDDGMIAFDCENIDQALNERCDSVDGCKTAAGAAANCNTVVFPFIPIEWENITEISEKWVIYEYRDKAGTGSIAIYSEKAEAVEESSRIWQNLEEKDRKTYFSDPVGQFYVGLFNTCKSSRGEILIGKDPIEIAVDFIK